MQEQNYKTVPSEREKLYIKVEEGKKKHLIALLLNKTGEVRTNVILRRVRVTIVAVENQ